MILHRKFFLFIVATLLFSKGYSQIFGGNPSSLKWKQINTPLVRVIFPEGLDSPARRITNIISYINAPTENTIGKRSKKINLVLQNQTTVSNAYVGLAPFRSEFFLTPDQNNFELGSLPWPDQLTIHEFRHVQQYNNFNVGLSKILHKIFGEEGQALANNASIPNWFFEGDAVYNETNVSQQGRGSLPFFFNAYRSLWNEGKHYRWMKLRNGSFKDFIPNHYELGYLLVAYGREKYGDDFWEKVTHDAASFKSLFYPFQHAIKKYSGKDYVAFRNDAFDFFKKEFEIPGTVQNNTHASKNYTSEEYPAFTEDGSIIFVKSGYKQIPEFIIRSNNIERKIRVRDYSLDNQFSYRNGKIIYASYRPDARWGYRDYSDLRVLNITNGKQQTLTNFTKYFSPDISEDGEKVIAVNVPPQGFSSLHLLDAHSGKLIEAVPNPDKLFYTYPKFYNNKKIISPVRNSSGKMSLGLIEIENGKTEYLTPFSFNVIGAPLLLNDTIYFTYSYKKNDEFFAYTLSEKKLWRINYKSDQGIGKYQPCVNDQFIAWSTFTASGYKLVKTLKTNVEFQEINTELMDKNTSSFGIASLNNRTSNLLYSVPDDSFIVTKYSKAFKLFNFHSIEPTADDPQYTLSLVSENILNTLQSQLAFTYDRSEKFKRISFGATYGAWFPFLSAGINYTIDRRALYHGNQVFFNEMEPYAGFNIPLNFSKGRSFTFLDFGSQYVYNQSDYKGKYKDTFNRISYSYSSSFLSFTHEIQKSVQQIFPRFAQTIDLTYKTTLSHYKGFQFLANANIFLPGLLENHSLVLNGAFLRKDSLAQINFSSGFPFSKGYNALNFYKMFKWGINYHLPLLYPDAGFGEIIYLLRIRANLFYDETHANDFYANGNSFKAQFRSAGTEINFDTKWWNEANVSIGLRYSYLFDADLFGGRGRNRWEIILPVNIFNQ